MIYHTYIYIYIYIHTHWDTMIGDIIQSWILTIPIVTVFFPHDRNNFQPNSTIAEDTQDIFGIQKYVDG